MTPTDRALSPLILDLIAAVDPTTGLDEWRAALQRLRMARSAVISDVSSVPSVPTPYPSDADALVVWDESSGGVL